ncbi:MAG: hypothetical protein QNL24_05740, partial [Akkermansiaceae bacterium]
RSRTGFTPFFITRKRHLGATFCVLEMAALILSFDARSLRLRALLLFQGQRPRRIPKMDSLVRRSWTQ